MKRLLIITLSNFALMLATTQASEINISGTIKNPEGEPLPFATVAVFAGADSSLLTATLTDTLGRYSIRKAVSTASYFVESSFLGAKTSSEAISLHENTGALTQNLIVGSSTELETVGVVGHRKQIEHFADRIQVNVENNSVNAGSSALGVLEKSPGVSVNRLDGSIQLMGRSNVLVLINNRPTHLSGQEIVAMLESMPGSELKNIELITSPSAKYEAEGTGGIININMKRPENEGFKGTAHAGIGYGKYLKHKEGLQINYSKSKLAGYVGADYNYDKKYSTLRFTNESTEDVYALSNQSDRSKPSLQIRSGLDYYLSPRSTLGINLSGNMQDGTLDANSVTDIRHAGITDSSLLQDVDAQTTVNSFQTMLNYQHRLRKEGWVVNVELDYFRNHEDESNRYDGYAQTSEQQTYRRWQLNAPSEVQTDIASLGCNLSLPLRDSSMLELGAKASQTTIDYEGSYAFDRDGQLENSATSFDYIEQIAAAYASWTKKIGSKLQTKWGLRTEQTVTSAEDKSNPDLIDQSELGIFPSAFAMYPLSNKHLAKLSYSKRLTRPDYDMLNPFAYYINPVSVHAGNPRLRPVVTHNIELGHVYNDFLNTNLFYNYSTDYFNQIAQNDDNVTTYIHYNLGTSHQTGLFTGGYKQIRNWWGIYANATVYYLRTDYDIAGVSISEDSYTANSSISSQFFLPKDLKIEINGFYQTPSVYGMYRTGQYAAANLAVSKQLGRKRNVNLNLRVDDIFKTGRSTGTMEYGDMKVRAENYQDSRQVWLTLSWNFGNNKVTQKDDSSSGIDEEKRRASNSRK